MQNQELKWKKQALERFAALPRKITNKQIAKETGLSVSWISDFTNGNITEPSVDKVETLLRYCESFK